MHSANAVVSYEITTIAEIIQGLESARRMGTERDLPEGARYIQLSDTLARKIVEVLRQQVHE